MHVADRIHALLVFLDVRTFMAELAFPNDFEQIFAIPFRADGNVGVIQERLVAAEEAFVNNRRIAVACAVDAYFLAEYVHYRRFLAMRADFPDAFEHPAILVVTIHARRGNGQ